MSSAPHSGTSQKGDMTFWEHINALRGVLIKSLLSVGILWLVFLPFLGFLRRDEHISSKE